MESVVPRQGDTGLPWHLHHIQVITWLKTQTWDGEQTLDRNIQALVYAHHELQVCIRAEARALQQRLGGSDALWAPCYRYSLAKRLAHLRYAHRFHILQSKLRQGLELSVPGVLSS
jgi:hypothetical protein